MKEAMRDLQKSNNMIKYKDEIMSRPKKEWFVGNKRRQEVAKESKLDLKNIGRKFNDQLTNQQRNKLKRDKKRSSKDEQAVKGQDKIKKGQSGFQNDIEGKIKTKFSKKQDEHPQSGQTHKYYKKKKHLKKK